MSPKKMVLRFPSETSDRPIIYTLIKDYDLLLNILKADINPQKEGSMIVEIEGPVEKYARGLEYLRSLGVSIQPLSQDVRRNDVKCVHCGACTNLCPTGALAMQRPAMLVGFNEDECVVCGVCVRACPVHAMEVRL